MAYLIQFRTARFDVSRETPNDMNPIAGQSVLLWLRAELARTNYHCTEPDQEDWGWYMDVKDPHSAYMVGASAEVGYKDDQGSALSYDLAPNAALDWTIQIHKQRTLKEKLLGRGKMAADDALCARVERIFREAEAIENVTVERDS